MARLTDVILSEIRPPFDCAGSERVKTIRHDIYVVRHQADLYVIKVQSTSSRIIFEDTILREAKWLVQGLNHGNVAKYFGLELTDTTREMALHYTGSIGYQLVIRYYPGEDLSQWASHSDNALNHQHIQTFLRDTLEGLEYLHSHQLEIIHCDIKPANLVLHNPHSRVVIIDFEGVAFEKKLKTELVTNAYTLIYAAPELLRSLALRELFPADDEISGKIDIWSLGCVAVQLCTGVTPSICMADSGEVLCGYFPTMSNLAESKAKPKLPQLDTPNIWNRRLIHFIAACFDFDPRLRKSAMELLSYDYIRVAYAAD